MDLTSQDFTTDTTMSGHVLLHPCNEWHGDSVVIEERCFGDIAHDIEALKMAAVLEPLNPDGAVKAAPRPVPVVKLGTFRGMLIGYDSRGYLLVEYHNPFTAGKTTLLELPKSIALA